MDFWGKSSGFADFKTVDRGSAVIFDADSGLYLSYVRVFGPIQNLDHRSFFSLGLYVEEFIQIIYFFERSSLKLRCDAVFGIVLCYVKYVAFFAIWPKLTMAFTCTSLPLNLYTSFLECGFVVSDLNKKFGGSTDLAKKRHGSADLHENQTRRKTGKEKQNMAKKGFIRNQVIQSYLEFTCFAGHSSLDVTTDGHANSSKEMLSIA